MATITFKGKPIETTGELPAVGNKIPGFELVKPDLSECSHEDFKGKKLIFNIFPSLDTPVCAKSVREFNTKASQLDNTTVLCVSADLPFAHNRFCEAEGLDKVVALSTFRSPRFGKDFGAEIATGPLRGLLSRAVVVTDEQGVVTYRQQVSEIADLPDYDAALAAIK